MASPEQVKHYLLYWCQLGKGIVIRDGEETLLPRPVIQGDRHSPAFETCWQQVMQPESGNCYLEGTQQTIAELLSADWEIVDCSRCQMPVPLPIRATSCTPCPCCDLPSWPNTELPLPRSPINNQSQLRDLCDRLGRMPVANPDPDNTGDSDSIFKGDRQSN